MGLFPTHPQIATPSQTVRKDPRVPMALGEGAWRLLDGWHVSDRWPPGQGPQVLPLKESMGTLRRVVLSDRGGEDEPENEPGQTTLLIYMETTDNGRTRSNQGSTTEASSDLSFTNQT